MFSTTGGGGTAEAAVIPGVKQYRFNGPAYDPEADDERLSRQIDRVFLAMRDGRWLTLAEIAVATGDPPASISAQLRHLRKKRFGAHTIDKRHRGEKSDGLWEYRLTVNEPVEA